MPNEPNSDGHREIEIVLRSVEQRPRPRDIVLGTLDVADDA